MKKVLCCFLALLLLACTDWTGDTGDDELIASDRLFGDESAYRNALNDIYIQLRAPHLYGGTLTLTLLEEAAGTIEPFDEATRAASRHDYGDEAVAQRIRQTALAAYRVMAACNEVIAAADEQTLQAKEPAMAVGEAYALRAAVQFDLTRLFHPLPADDPQFRGLPYMERNGQADSRRLTTGELLQRIEQDLSTAARLLRSTDPLLSAANTVAAVGQADRRLRTMQMNWYAVKALQARVALWQGHYDQVISAADSVFMHQRQVTSRNQVFYYVQPGKYGSDFCFSREFIFGIATAPSGFPQLSDSLFLRQAVKTCSQLPAIYADVADIRYRTWFRPAADGVGYVMSRKFSSETLLSGYVVSSTGGEMQLPASIPYVKLGEVALMAAEALNATGHTDQALALLEELLQSKDAVSYAADLPKNESESLQQAVRQLINDEYERDLFGEGQLFYHYKRTKGGQAYTLPLPANL